MKIRIIPDLHGHNWWKKYISDITFLDKIIFLGDYVDDWSLPDADIIRNLEDLIKLKKEYSDKVILLKGNHEWNYIPPFIGYCSGYRNHASIHIQKILKNNEDLFLDSYGFDVHKKEFNHNFLFSHGGFTNSWIRLNSSWMIPDLEDDKDFESYVFKSAKELSDRFNKKYPDSYMYETSCDDIFIRAKMSISRLRGGWNKYSGPFWADLREGYNDQLVNIHQFVGHTPLTKYYPESFIINSNTSITYCDMESKEILIDLIINPEKNELFLYIMNPKDKEEVITDFINYVENNRI